ncbi:shikimate kinase [uncultured Clostridium sp.]|uniref:shikimate kinase n=1 Tax=uncultured Clostridium sp. TaxID=59620 RepID=UPI0025E5EF3D|nr:shikimate kinase [uncultured Clostridium sp.]
MKSKIVFIGMPGCGKTTIGRIISKQLKMNFYDMDDYIEKISSSTVAELFEKGEEYFRNIETQACRELAQKKDVLISTGGGVVKRKENIEILKEDSIIIFLDRPVENIFEDVDVSNRPLLKDGKQKLLNLYEERYELYKESADKVVINDGNIKDVVNEVKEIVFFNNDK